MARKRSRDEGHSPVSLSLEARPENAAVARRAVGEEATRAGLAEALGAAAKLIVTEGFNNALRHAHSGGKPERADKPERGGRPERVVVRASGNGDGITVEVRDFGGGFRPRVPEADRGTGFGLALIAALADRVELHRHREGGMEVRARIERSRLG